MPFDFSWHDDGQTIIRIDVHGNTKWEEYHQVIDKVIHELETTTHRIDIIIHDPHSGMPSGNPMPHIKATSQKLAAHPNMGVIVLASDRSTSVIVKTLVSMVYRVYGIDTRIIGEFVNTIEEAEASITKERTQAALV